MREESYKNPIPTVDIIIENDCQILLIKRKNDPFKGYLALPGGFVNEGEQVEDAAKREAKEETSLDIEPLNILGVYSDPKRDPRGHIMSSVFIATSKLTGNHNLGAVAKDDAVQIEWTNIEDIGEKTLAFDHKRIISDYKSWKKSGGTFWSSKIQA